MTLEYSLEVNDYLQHQLYIASKSERVKNKRLKSWIIVTLSFVSLAVLFFQNDNVFLMYYFVAASVLCLIFYPLYLRYYYKRHYLKSITDSYKNRFGEVSTVTFTQASIETIDKTGEAKINLSEIESIDETSHYTFVRMKTGGSLIIPKLKIENPDTVRAYLTSLAHDLKINYNTELNWRWK